MVSKNNNWIEDSDVLSIIPTFGWMIQSTSEFRDSVQTRVLNFLNRMNPDLAEFSLVNRQSDHQLYKDEPQLGEKL